MPTKGMPKATLMESNPAIAAQWHPNKNAKLLPTDVTAGSNKRIWWQCAKRPLHVWEAVIQNRAKGDDCPYCSGRKVLPDDSIMVTHPEIAAEWHPEKNNELRPTEVGSGSSRRVWWQCTTDCRHVWTSIIAKRTGRNQGCPYCSGRVCLPEDSILVTHPKVAALWDQEYNGSALPTDVSFGSNREFSWACPAGHRWKNTVQQQVFRSRCLYCDGRPLEFELHKRRDTAFTVEHPDVATEWHPHLNGFARPADYTGGSGFMAWWQCSRKPDHVWRTTIANRCKAEGTGCPKCVPPQTSRPELRIRAEMEHIFGEVVGRYQPLGDSRKEVDVYLPGYKVGIEYDGARYHTNPEYDEDKRAEVEKHGIALFRVREHPLPMIGDRDILSGRKFTFQAMSDLVATIAAQIVLTDDDRNSVKRYVGSGAFQALDRYGGFVSQLPGPALENSLAEQSPEIATELHPYLNNGLRAEDLTFGSNEPVWWQCSKYLNHEWQAPPSRRTGRDRRGCPHCYRLNKPQIGRIGSAQRLAPFYKQVVEVLEPIMTSMRRDGVHDAEIADELNRRGIQARKPGPWTKQRVYLVRHLIERLSR
jgi:Probable Zinc-ribbon domain